MEIDPIFNLSVMWNIANENSLYGEFFYYFLIFYVRMILERYFFSSRVTVKILDIVKESYVGFA